MFNSNAYFQCWKWGFNDTSFKMYLLLVLSMKMNLIKLAETAIYLLF